MNSSEQKLTSEVDEMKKMKQRLIEYKELNADIENSIERLERLEEKMYSISPQMFSDIPRGSVSSNNKFLNLIEKKDELERKIRTLIEKRDTESMLLEKIVDSLKKSNEKAVIYLRYFDDEEWEKIIEMLFGDCKNFERNYDCYRQKVFRLHSSAIANMSQIVAFG